MRIAHKPLEIKYLCAMRQTQKKPFFKKTPKRPPAERFQDALQPAHHGTMKISPERVSPQSHIPRFPPLAEKLWTQPAPRTHIKHPNLLRGAPDTRFLKKRPIHACVPPTQPCFRPFLLHFPTHTALFCPFLKTLAYTERLPSHIMTAIVKTHPNTERHANRIVVAILKTLPNYAGHTHVDMPFSQIAKRPKKKAGMPEFEGEIC